jgi:hypothetical protein
MQKSWHPLAGVAALPPPKGKKLRVRLPEKPDRVSPFNLRLRLAAAPWDKVLLKFDDSSFALRLAAAQCGKADLSCLAQSTPAACRRTLG